MKKIMPFLAVFGLVSTMWAADPTLGTWKLNFAKSKIPASEAANLKETVLVFREMDGNVMEGIQTQTLKDGKTNTMKWTTPMNGGIQTYQEGGPANGISSVAVKIDSSTIYNVYLLNGKQVGLAHVAFGKNFKTFTMTGKSADAQGKPFDYLAFFEKQ
jgi:hypothetical protein